MYRRGSNGFITEKTILFQVSRGGPTFSSGWGGGGVQILISIEPHITCDFPGVGWGGGGPDPLFPYGSAHKHRGSTTDRNRSLNMRTD